MGKLHWNLNFKITVHAWRVFHNVWMCNVCTGSCVGNAGLQAHDWKHWSPVHDTIWEAVDPIGSGRGGGWRVMVCPCLLPALSLLIQQDKAKQSHISTGIAKNTLNHHAFHTMMNSTPNCEPKWTPHPLKLSLAMYLITVTRKNIDSMLRTREYTFFSNYSWVHSWDRFL